MRVVSLVPSWTETLIHAGVNVVGRSRFCIHPRPTVKAIPAVGGTKHWNWKAIQALKPDLLILDKEENPKFMAEQQEIPVLATHVTSVRSMPGALAQMALRLGSVPLGVLAQRWNNLSGWQGLPRWQLGKEIPGFLDWGREPKDAVNSIIYVIWRNPWMTVSQETFISSVLNLCGLGPYLRDFDTKYPEFNLSAYSAQETMLLFSSEPYPFLRKRAVLNPVEHPYAFVDGQCFSWFGVRALEFLEGLRDGKEARKSLYGGLKP